MSKLESYPISTIKEDSSAIVPLSNEDDTEKKFFAPTVIEEGKNELVVSEEKPKNEVALSGDSNTTKRTGKIRIGLVDATSLMESRVRDIADEHMTTEKGELRGMSGIFKKIWKHNLAREYYRQKEMALVRENIAKAGTAFVDQDNQDQDQKIHQAAMGAIVNRFVTDGEEMMHNGEARKTLEEGDDNDTQASLKNLVMRYGRGEIADASAFELEKQQIIESLKGTDANVKFADNLFAVAEQVRQAIDTGESSEALEKDLEIVTGNARAGVRMEANMSACDRLIEKLHSTKLGAMVNETTLALAVGSVWSIGTFAGTRLTSSKLAAIASFGGTAAMGAGVAAMRESGHMKQDRAQHIRDIAQGKTIDPENQDRRGEMQESTYEMFSAQDLTTQIQNALFEENAEGERVAKQNISQEDINSALRLIAEAEARIKISDTKQIDLLSYTSVGNVEGERFALDIARAQTKVEIRKLLTDHPELLPQNAGATVSAEQYLKDVLSSHTQNVESSLQSETHKRDEIFDKMRRKHMGKAALKALGTGLLLGTVTQEALAFATDQQGLVEGLVSGHNTPGSSETLAQYLAGNKIAELPPEAISSSEHLSAQEWMSHQSGVTEVKRLGWYDNDTSNFDKNELKLNWGGKNGTGINSNGDYVFSVKNMLAGGSEHGALSANAQQLAKEGKLEMLISASKDTQGQVLRIPINADGTAVFDAKNEALARFFTMEDGKAVFKGQYAEVAEVVKSADASDAVEQVRVLATHIGKGEVDTSMMVPTPTIDIPTVEPPVIVPLMPLNGRDPLEKMKKDDTDKKSKPSQSSNESSPGPRKPDGTRNAEAPIPQPETKETSQSEALEVIKEKAQSIIEFWKANKNYLPSGKDGIKMGNERLQQLFDTTINPDDYSDEQMQSLVDILGKEDVSLKRKKDAFGVVTWEISASKEPRAQETEEQSNAQEKEEPSNAQKTKEQSNTQEESKKSKTESVEKESPKPEAVAFESRKMGESDQSYFQRCQVFLTKTLDLEPDASYTEINKARRSFIQKHHPDKNLQSSEAEQNILKNILTAFNALTVRERKKREAMRNANPDASSAQAKNEPPRAQQE